MLKNLLVLGLVLMYQFESVLPFVSLLVSPSTLGLVLQFLLGMVLQYHPDL